MKLNIFQDLNVSVTPHALLSNCTTFRLGGPCHALIECETPDQLQQVVTQCAREQLSFLLIGCGSNIVVSDKGIESLVIRYASESPQIIRDGNDLVISGSTLLDRVAEYAVQEGLDGINFASGIPGTIGGAIVGNAGAFGKQIGDVVQSAHVLDGQGQKKEVSKQYFEFEYRNSILKRNNEILLSVRLALQPGGAKELQEKRQEILKLRKDKHPDWHKEPCAGSIFRNLDASSASEKRQAAGWFLDQAGVKELSCGGAKVYEKHANIIVANDKAKAQDVFDLAQMMAKCVKEKFGIDLVLEVRFVGKNEA